MTIDLKDDNDKDADKADIERQRGDAKLKKAVSD